MQVNKVKYYIFAFLFAINLAGHSKTKDSTAIAMDSSKITPITFSENLSEKYEGDEFDYNTIEGEAENFLARFLNWILKGLQDTFGITINPEIANVLEIIIYIVLICFAAFLIIKVLIGKNPISLFRKKDSVVAHIAITEEHIEKINLDELINNALLEKNYRLAIRYMYLKALQDLSIKKIIDYHFEKTNTDYYKEILDMNLKQNFTRISYLYEYIWYGKFELDENGYQSAKKSFDQLNTSINNFG